MPLPITAPTYVQDLYRSLLLEGFDDLAESIAPIETFVRNRWSNNHMPWFTDHGPLHSRTVAEAVLNLATPPYVYNPLNTVERYVLWAAAWLHDVGMQSLLGMRLGSIGSTGHDNIRSEHPNESFRVILQNTQLIGLQARDRPLHNAIAHVARAHGTEYYADSVRYLEQELPVVRGIPFRGALLAALLLMADELDLGYQRALKQSDIPEELNTVSNAHALKHDCVLSATAKHLEDGAIKILVRTIQAPEVPDLAMDTVERWIFDKLRAQIGKTELQIAGGFGGQVRFSRAIEFQRTRGESSASAPEPATLHHIQATNARNELIDHRGIFGECRAALRDGYSVVLTGSLAGKELIDQDGREALLSALLAEARDWGAEVCLSDCLIESQRASSLRDVLRQLLGEAQGTASSDLRGIVELDRQLKQLVADLDGQLVIAVSSLDLLEPSAADRMLDILAQIDDASGVRVIVTCEADGSVHEKLIDAGLFAGDCRRLDRIGVAESLSSCLPINFSREEAAAENLPYSHYAGLRLRHLRPVR